MYTLFIGTFLYLFVSIYILVLTLSQMHKVTHMLNFYASVSGTGIHDLSA